MNKLLLVLFAFLTTPLFAASPIIYYGTHSKDLTTAGLITQALQAGSTGQFNVSTVGLVSTTNGLRVGSSAQFQVSSVGNVITTGNVSAGGLLSVDGNSHSFSFAGANLTSDYTVQVPATSGTVGQYMATDGSGNLNWRAPPTEKNYLAAGTNDSTGWAASGAGITCTTASTNLPDASVGTALAVTGVSGSTAFCYADYDVDVADYSKVLKLVFDQAPVSGYVASDFKVDVYSCTVAWVSGSCSGTSTRLSLSTDSSSITALPNLTGTVTPPPTYSAPNGTAPHVQVQIGLNAASTHQMNFAQVLTGPGTVVQSAVATGWYASTAPGGGWINTGPTNVSVSVNEQRTGSSVFLDYSITATGASAAFTSLVLNLPVGYALDPAYLPLTSSGALAFERLGEGQIFRSGSNSGNLFAVNNGTSTTSILVYYEAGTFPDLRTNVTNTAPVSWTNVSSVTYLHLRTKLLPIASMAGQGTVFLGSGQGDFAYNTSGITSAGASDTTSFGYGPAGAAIGSINSSTANSGTTMRVQFLTPNQIGDAYIIEVDRGSGGAYWIPVSQSDNICSAGCTQTTSSYGVAIDNIGSNWVDVSFGNMGRLPNGATYGAAGVSTWASIGTWRWHVHRVHGGAPTGFAAATRTNPGLVLGNLSRVRAHLSTNQSCAASTTCIVGFDTKTGAYDFDTNGELDVVTNKGRFTATAAGYYRVACKATVDGAVAADGDTISVYKSGNRLVGGTPGQGNNPSLATTDIVFLNGSTDYLDCRVFNGNAAARTIDANGSDPGAIVMQVTQLP